MIGMRREALIIEHHIDKRVDQIDREIAISRETGVGRTANIHEQPHLRCWHTSALVATGA
jgi:hypothetical protein